MPKRRGRPRKIKPSLVLKPIPPEKREPTELEEFIREASEVRQITTMAGWAILERDLKRYQQALVTKLAYLNHKRPEAYEARLLYIATDKLLALVNDYEVNRDKAIEMLNKLQNPELNVTMDIDNE